MPRRKQTKCNQTVPALKKKKCSAEKYNKQNVSAQRFPKSKTHLNQWNYIKYTGYKSTHKENEKEAEDGEDAFGLSPAYLCECTLQTQDTSLAPEDPSKEYSFEKGTFKTNLLKRKEIPSNAKVIKRNDINNQNQKYSPAFLCESILQAEDTSVALGPVNSTGSNSKNSLLQKNLLKKKKQQHNNKNEKHCAFNDQGQEFSSGHLYRSKLQCNYTSAVSDPNPSNVYCSKKRLLESNPLKEKKSKHNSKKIKVNEENNHNYEYSPAFLCESIILSEETKGVSEYDPSKENCSTNSLLGRNPRKKTKPQIRSKTLKNNEINNRSQKYSSEDLSKNTVQSGYTLEVSESGPSKAYCSENSFLKINSQCKKNTQCSIKVFKNTDITITQQFKLVNFNNSTLQSKDTSLLLESDPSKEYCSENKLLQNHSQDTKKPQRTSKRQKKNQINIKTEQNSKDNLVVSEYGSLRKSKNSVLEQNLLKQKGQQNNSEEIKSNAIINHTGTQELLCNSRYQGPLQLCKSTLQTEHTSVLSEPDPSKKFCSENQLFESHPQDSKKPRRTSKRQKKNKINIQAQECSSVTLCNNVLQSEDFSVILKPDPIKGRCSKTKLLKYSPLKKKKLKRNKKEDKTNAVGNSIPEDNHAFPCESTLQCEDTSVVSEPSPSKKFCSENKLLESFSQDTKKRQPTSKRQKKEKKKKCQEFSPEKFYNGTSQFEDFSVISKPGSLKLKCSKTRLLKYSPLKKKKLKRNKKEDKTNAISNSIPEDNHAAPCESTLDSEDTSVASESDSLRKSCFVNSFLENYPLKKKELQNDSEELKSNEVTNHLQEHGTLHLCENTLQSQEPAVVSKSDPLKDDCSKIRVSERISRKKKDPFSYNENSKVKNNEITAALIDESMSQAEDTSLESECDPSMDCSSKNRTLEKDIHLSHEGLFHSDLSVISSEVSCGNQGSSTEEISFIECNLFDCEPKHRNPAMEVDPLEWRSTVLDELECNQKDDDLKETNPLDTDITQNSIKMMNLSNVSDVGSTECDLHLECTLEDSEPLEPDFQEEDCNSEESDVLGSVCSSFDIKITQLPERFSISDFELMWDSGTIPTSLHNIKVTSETLKNDRKDGSKIETKHLTNMDEIKLLENNSEKMNSMKREITFNEIKIDYENLRSESNEGQTKENHSLQCIDPESSLRNLGESSSMSIQEEMKKTDSIKDNEITSEVSAVLEQIMTIVELSEFSWSGKLNPKDEPAECCTLKIEPVDEITCSLKDNQSVLSSLPIKNDGIDYKMEDDKNHTFSHLTGESSDENYGRGSPEMLPSSGFIKVSKERLNFHEERVLKVLLRRLEDEEIFKVWKKDGVISLLKHSSSKTTLGWKRTHSLCSNIQKSLKKRKNYKCWVCKKSFKNRERYWQHRASKCDRVRVFGCGNCNRKYILKKMLDEHRTKCISLKYFRCNVCLKLFNNQGRLDEHSASKCDTQKAFYCDVCNRGFIFKRLLLIHKTPICTSLRRYKCSICHQSFDKINLKTHKLKEHGIGILPTVLCEFCGKLVNRRHFSDHRYIHFGNPLYRCKDCSKVFRNKEARRHHEQYHTDRDAKPCICADCGKAFKRLAALKKHVSGHGNFHKCNTCGKVILNQFCFRIHVKNHIKAEDRSEEGLKCEIKQEPCDEDNSQCIKDEKPFKCSECEEIFIDRITMEQHLQSVHQTPLHIHGSENKTEQYQGSFKDKIRPFKCDRCSSCFLRQKYLNQHIRKNHNALYGVKPAPEDKPFKCETCESSFLKKVNLNRHRRRMHNAPAFVRNIVKTPTEEKTYACDICRTCYSHKKSLSRHRSRVHYVNSGNLLYPCAFCDEKFKTNANFKEHTFEHFKDCFSVTTNVKEEEKLYESSDVKILRNDVKTPTQSCSVTTNVKEEEKLFSSSDVKSVRNDVQTPTQSCSVTTIIKQEEILFSSSDVKTVRNDVQTRTQERPYVCDICGNCFGEKRNLNRHRSRMHSIHCSVTTNMKQEEKLFSSSDVKTVRNDAQTPTPPTQGCSVTTNMKQEEKLFSSSDVKTVRNDAQTPTPPTQGCSVTTNMKQEEKLFSSSDVKTVRNDVQTRTPPTQGCSVTTNMKQEEKLFSNSDVKTVRNDVQTRTPPTQGCSVTTNMKQEEKLFSSSDVKTVRNDVQTRTQERPYVCDICGNCFGEKRNLNRHRSRIHSSRLLHPCSFCNEKFKTDTDLKDHTFQHFKNGFSVSTNVKEEETLFIRTGLKEKSEFSDSYLQQPEEDSHLKQQEEASTSIDSKKEEGVISSDRLDESVNRLAHLENNPGNLNDHKSKVYACRECRTTFNTRYSQKRHVCLHKLGALQSTIGRDVHACEECGVIFFEKWRLNTHLLSHSSLSFKCDICKKCFTTQLKLSVHMLEHGVKTSAELTFQCSTCNKLFPSSKKLEDHMILHTEQNPYQCTKCNRKFTTQFSLKRHNDNIHVDKRFLCNYCNMSFVSFSSLNQHVTYVHKKSVSLTEYVLKIDDDLQDQTPTEADYLTDNNLQDEGTAEVSLPAQVFSNIGNMFMYSNLFKDTPLQSEKQSVFRQDGVNTKDMSGLTGDKEAPSPLEFTIKIADR